MPLFHTRTPRRYQAEEVAQKYAVPEHPAPCKWCANLACLPRVAKATDLACPCGNGCGWENIYTLPYGEWRWRFGPASRDLSTCGGWVIEADVAPHNDHDLVTVRFLDVSPEGRKPAIARTNWESSKPDPADESTDPTYYNRLAEWMRSEPPIPETPKPIAIVDANCTLHGGVA